MSNYLEKHLSDGEHILLEAKTTLRAALPHFILCGFTAALGANLIISDLMGRYSKKGMGVAIGVALIIIGVLIVIFGILNIKATKLLVTDKKVIGKANRKYSVDLLFDRIESVVIKRDLIGAIMKFRTVIIVSASEKYAFPSVANYDEIRQAIMERIGTI